MHAYTKTNYVRILNENVDVKIESDLVFGGISLHI